MILDLPEAEQLAAIAAMSSTDLAALRWQLAWDDTARDKQTAPEGDWSQWGVMAGRGFGKTLLGAQWIAWEAWCDPEALPSAVICPTQADVRYTAFEGPAGIISIVPPELVKDYNRSDLIITLVNGATIRGFSAEKAERLRGPQHSRIWCFIAGTLVSTPTGDVPIETLRPGDWVLTRKGARRVQANSVRAGMPVGSVTFSTGAKLVGTADHPVYLNSGWTRLDQLEQGDTVCALPAWSGAISAGTDTTAATTSARTRASSPSAPYACTARSGKAPTAPRLTGTTCTTSTRTRATTALRTFTRCLTALTARTTSSARLSLARTGRSFLTCVWPARTAAPSYGASASRQSHAAPAATRSTPISSGWSTALAATAAKRSDPALATFAASVASTWQPQGRQSVYCLKVDGEPEYFANGILVHNCDELAAWQYADDTWDMAMMGLRLGPTPKILWTTTPKPIELVRKLVTPQPGRVITRGSTYENRDHLPQTFFDQLVQYEGTTIGRQELDGELIDPEEAGIIKRSWLRLWPAKKPLPPFDWIVMSLDTAFTEATTDRKNGADFSACTVWGVFRHEERSQVLLLDCWQEQLGLPDLMKRVKRELNVAYGDDQDTALIKPLFGSSKMASAGRKVDICVIEDKGSGISLRQMLDREGITAYAYNPGRADKLSRLHMVSSVFARRQVWLPESDKHAKRPRTWVEPMLAQLCAFTGAGSIKHDDFVDSCSQAIRLLMDKNMLSAMKLDKKGSEPEYVPPKHYTNPYAS